MGPARAATNAAGDRRRAGPARVRIGYGRVSTRDQHLDLEAQHDALTAAGCEQVYVDVASGKLAARPELDKTLACLRKGDTLVITRLDRLGRSLPHLLEVSAELRERNVDLIVLQQQIDTSTPPGACSSRCSAPSASSSATCSPNAPATGCRPR
jgi:predicted site-specific integrase-resolvase